MINKFVQRIENSSIKILPKKKIPNKWVKNKYVIEKIICQKAGPNLVWNQFLIYKKLPLIEKKLSKIKGLKIKIMVLT